MRNIKTTITTIFLTALLLPSSLFAGETTNSGYLNNQAEAYFSSAQAQGCEDIVVGVSVFEPEKVKPNTPLSPPQAFVFGVFNNICDIGSSFVFADVVNLEDGDFDQKGLNSASLNLVANIGGFDVVLDLDWVGTGKTEKSKNAIHIKNEEMMVHDSDVIASRASDISGVFLVNGVNYAVGTETGGLSTARAHTVQIEK